MGKSKSVEREVVDYKDIKAYNFSRIKDFYKLGLFNYHKKYILGLEVEDKDSSALVVGSAVDCLLFEGQNVFEQKFYIGDNQKIPSGKGGEFAKELHRQLKTDTPFDLAFKRAYEHADMADKLFDSFTSKFEGSEIQLYLQSLIESEGKTPISLGDVAASHKILDTLQHHSRTRFLFEMDGYSQLELTVDYNGYKLKMKLDKLLVDKKNRILRPYDLKVFYSVDDFEYRYVKDMYYLQEAIYMLGVKKFRDTYYPGYAIDDFKFCVSHSANLSLPVIYNMKVADGEGDLYEGFTVRSGRRYKGLDEMLFEVKWHEENNVWNTTWELYTSKGLATKVL